MKQIIIDTDDQKIHISDVDSYSPIFAKKDGKLSGMLVKEDAGWILRIGNIHGSHGHHKYLQRCIEKGLEFGYTFHVED